MITVYDRHKPLRPSIKLIELINATIKTDVIILCKRKLSEDKFKKLISFKTKILFKLKNKKIITNCKISLILGFIENLRSSRIPIDINIKEIKKRYERSKILKYKIIGNKNKYEIPSTLGVLAE